MFSRVSVLEIGDVAAKRPVLLVDEGVSSKTLTDHHEISQKLDDLELILDLGVGGQIRLLNERDGLVVLLDQVL